MIFLQLGGFVSRWGQLVPAELHSLEVIPFPQAGSWQNWLRCSSAAQQSLHGSCRGDVVAHHEQGGHRACKVSAAWLGCADSLSAVVGAAGVLCQCQQCKHFCCNSLCPSSLCKICPGRQPMIRAGEASVCFPSLCRRMWCPGMQLSKP